MGRDTERAPGPGGLVLPDAGDDDGGHREEADEEADRGVRVARRVVRRGRDVVLRVVEVDAELVAGGAQLGSVRPLEKENHEEVDGRNGHGEAGQGHHAALVVHALCGTVRGEPVGRHGPRRHLRRRSLGCHGGRPRRWRRLLRQHGGFRPGVAVPPALTRAAGRVLVPPRGRAGIAAVLTHHPILPKLVGRPEPAGRGVWILVVDGTGTMRRRCGRHCARRATKSPVPAGEPPLPSGVTPTAAPSIPRGLEAWRAKSSLSRGVARSADPLPPSVLIRR